MKSASLRLIVVAMLIAVAVVGGHLLPGLDATEIDREIRNGLHLIGFALIAAVIFEALSMRPLSAVVTTLLLVASLGALAEFVQSLDGKGYDLADLTRDVAGAATYLCARLVWNWTNAEARSSVARFSARLLSIVLGVLLFFPLSYWLSVNAGIAAKFPTIMDFEGRWDAYTYSPVNAQVRLVNTTSTASEFTGSSVDILLLHRRWSGLNIKPVVSDWSSYQFLTMRIAITGGHDNTISVELSDVEHPGYRIQHFVGVQSVGPDSSVIRFPLRAGREIDGRPDLDLSDVRAIYIIAKTRHTSTNKQEEIRMYLDDIRLE